MMTMLVVCSSLGREKNSDSRGSGATLWMCDREREVGEGDGVGVKADVKLRVPQLVIIRNAAAALTRQAAAWPQARQLALERPQISSAHTHTHIHKHVNPG